MGFTLITLSSLLICLIVLLFKRIFELGANIVNGQLNKNNMHSQHVKILLGLEEYIMEQ